MLFKIYYTEQPSSRNPDGVGKTHSQYINVNHIVHVSNWADKGSSIGMIGTGAVSGYYRDDRSPERLVSDIENFILRSKM